MWTEAPTVNPTHRRGRHEAHLADSRPKDFDTPLSGGNVRWRLLALAVALVAGLGALGYWFYQGAATQREASIADVNAGAAELRSSLPTLLVFSDGLLDPDSGVRAGDLFDIEAAARSLFAASGALPQSQTDMRLSSSQAASSALDAVRLANSAHTFRAAVLPILTTPELQTDPDLIGLDEAVRAFGEWQLTFDTARRAVSDNILPGVKDQLDLLSGELGLFLSRYVDALRLDDRAEAELTLQDLGSRLDEIGTSLTAATEDVQTRVAERIEDAGQALTRIGSG